MPEVGTVSPGVQQPHSEEGRLVQQARGVETAFAVQAEATSATDTIPMTARRATQRGRN